ncbi:MAG TPA: nickel-binding protein [Nitrososphaeraceae archaeon]|nr:nickel-binding protein [Nitrososphaeraceae archaeon]
MPRHLDSHKIGSFTEEQLMELRKSPVDEFGVKHLNILYKFEANVVYCLIEAPSREAVELNHAAKLNCSCDWITEVKTTS